MKQFFFAVMLLLSAFCTKAWAQNTVNLSAKEASSKTVVLNQTWYDTLDFDDISELENAKRGLVEGTNDIIEP